MYHVRVDVSKGMNESYNKGTKRHLLCAKNYKKNLNWEIR